ncbi:hypothetical protein [Mycobacterium gastri]|uniref:Uncharacterized protein n=1 Tax=Mycobacterium gastri TaxID=1777 RepID=A0A1X1VPU6_MYCGS|nr:hypothetical protein [Mycobacterium gastri]ETW26506.1 hypothetical protein MGAST_18105 [Mycobacterium gastri 'Wayne']ORV71100.1 hypothetical protein AWC07_04955 [Mycobacterium gastri]
MTTANAAEIRRLRGELVRRFEIHPPSTWSLGLLTVVVAAVDLQFGGPTGGGVNIAPGLRVVRSGER